MARCPTVRTSLVALVLLALLFEPTLGQESKLRPNIVVIMSDDMGYTDIGCYGGEIETPVLDRLAQNGVRFSPVLQYVSLLSDACVIVDWTLFAPGRRRVDDVRSRLSCLSWQLESTMCHDCRSVEIRWLRNLHVR